MYGQMTEWRIGETLSLQWADVDLKAGRATTKADTNKGKRDAFVPLHPVVIEHLQKIRSFHPNVFTWNCHRRTLYIEFARIQDAPGIDLPCAQTNKREGYPHCEKDAHECTDACHRYGFHDGRRSFASMNAIK